MADELVTSTTSGAEGAPGGAAPSGSHVQGPVQGAPSSVDISDDMLVRVPGQQEPVKYGELAKRLQGDHTRKTQALAKQRAALENERKQWQSQRDAKDSELRNLTAQLLSHKNQPQGEDQFLSALGSMEYLDGKTAAQLVKVIKEQGFAPIVEGFKARDQVIQAMYKTILDMNQRLSTLSGAKSETDFDAKIRAFVKDADIPDAAVDWAKELYLAYEGDDLDEEFPDILVRRWNGLQGLIRESDKRRASDARRKINLPGKGGAGIAGKPAGLKGNESAAEVADLLWESLQDSET